jgi:uncharacterized protein YbjT (DUF2867 family)
MRICLLGATGRTGRPFAEDALAAGHEVVALVRDEGRLGALAGRVTAVRGEAGDADAVARAAQGADVIVSTIGPAKGSPAGMMERAARAVVVAATAEGARIVWMTGAGVRDPGDEPKVIDRLVVAAMRLTARRVLEDSAAAVAVVRSSGCPWVVVRAPRLTDKPATGAARTGLVGPDSGTQVPRADVAAFLLRACAEDEWLGRMPVVWA